MAQAREQGARRRASRTRRGRARRRAGVVVGRAVVSALLLAAGAAFAVGSLRGSGGTFLASSSQGAPFSPVAEGPGEGLASSEGSSEARPEQVAAGEPEDGRPTSDGGREQVFVVHVDGAVASPGVYELRGALPRRRDAVEAAGGLVAGADTTLVNLAAPVSDGEKLHVPFEGEQPQTTSAATGVGAGAQDVSGGGLVNLNTADAEELCTLPGVGEATAADIVADRERNGPFSSVEDLMRVSGIGERKLARLRERVCV